MADPTQRTSRTPGSGGAWTDLVAGAPGLARRVRARFEANLHHVIGTVRSDGAPRLSGTEVAFEDGDVRLGMMPRSRKLADVRRDPRVELHSAPLEEDLAQGDAKLSGTLVADDDVDADGPGEYFSLQIHRAGLVRVADEELVFSVWTPRKGVRTIRRR